MISNCRLPRAGAIARALLFTLVLTWGVCIRGFAADPQSVASPPASASSQPRISVARSALLTVDAQRKDDMLALRIRRNIDQTGVKSDEVKVSIDGHSEQVSPQSDGTYEFSVRNITGNGSIDIIVAHDGIREILSGKLTPEESSGSVSNSLLGDHKQMAWWILNVVIVAVAAMALSRRKSS